MMGMKKRVKKKKGGKSFPDLTGDGKVTKKDILKGRGVKLKRGGKGGGKDVAGKNPADKRSALTAVASKLKESRKKKMGGGSIKKRAKAMGGGMMKKRMKRGGKVK